MTTLKPRRVHYPTGDRKPFSESDWHFDAMAGTLTSLKMHFMDRADVYVSANNFLYWEEGNPKARISPDVYVVFGVPGHLRDCYMAWNEGGRLPSFVLEATSRKTRHEDTKTKMLLYEQTLRVSEYFLFDPNGDYLKPRLQGYRLEEGRYAPLEHADNRLHSEQLGLDFVQTGEYLSLFDPKAGGYLPSTAGHHRRVQQALEAEITRLRAEIDALRGKEL